jgi:hypothetical protein
MTSPRDEDMPDRLVEAGEGIRKEWRVVTTTRSSGVTNTHDYGGSRIRAERFAALFTGPDYFVVVESRHVTPWQPDPGVGVAQSDGEAGQRTPTPATPDFPPEWIAEHGSGVDL